MYRIRVYCHATKKFIANKIVDAKSLSVAARLAEIHFADIYKKSNDVTLKVDELYDSKNNS
jgi:hypothetical protein